MSRLQSLPEMALRRSGGHRRNGDESKRLQIVKKQHLVHVKLPPLLLQAVFRPVTGYVHLPNQAIVRPVSWYLHPPVRRPMCRRNDALRSRCHFGNTALELGCGPPRVRACVYGYFPHDRMPSECRVEDCVCITSSWYDHLGIASHWYCFVVGVLARACPLRCILFTLLARPLHCTLFVLLARPLHCTLFALLARPFQCTLFAALRRWCVCKCMPPVRSLAATSTSNQLSWPFLL
jgi:hypothetical protein